VADKAKQYIGIGSKWLQRAGTNIAKVTVTIRATVLLSRPTPHLLLQQLLAWRISPLCCPHASEQCIKAVSASTVGSSLWLLGATCCETHSGLVGQVAKERRDDVSRQC